MPSTYNVEMEQLVLSCVLKEATCYDQIEDEIGMVGSNVWWWQPHKVIWKAFSQMAKNETYIDEHTLLDYLEKTGLLGGIFHPSNNEVSGKDYIKFITSQDSNPEKVEDYFNIVKEKYASRQLNELKDWTAAALEKGKHPVEILTHYDIECGKIATVGTSSSKGLVTFEDAILGHYNETLKAIETGESPYISSGLRAWDHFFGGFYPGRVYMLVGGTGTGKSAFAQCITYIMALTDEYLKKFKKNRKIGFISLEMSAQEILSRFVQMRTGIDSKRIESGQMLSSELEKYQEAIEYFSKHKHNIIFDQSSELNCAQIRQKIRKMKSEGCDLIVVDQLEQISIPSNMLSKSASEILNWIGYRIKSYAGESNVPVLLLHQTNRSADAIGIKKDVEINTTVVSQGGQKGMNGIAVIRHEMENGEIVGTKLHVPKNRHGRTGTEELEFDGSRLWFKTKRPAFPEELDSEPVFTKTMKELNKQSSEKFIQMANDEEMMDTPFDEELSGD